MIRVLVVDDEPLARERIRSLLEADGRFQVAGESPDGAAALEALQVLQVDLLFLDIQMPGMDGLEVASRLAREGRLPWVVFVTAFDRYALDAFRHHALDYVLKPLDPDRFQEALDHVAAMAAAREPDPRTPAREDLDRRMLAMLEAHERRRAARPHLAVQDRDHYSLVPVQDIHCLEATGNYVCLHCGAASHFLRGTLASVEEKLDGDRFLRTHRSWIVNLDHVLEARPVGKGAWELLTRGGHRVPLSPTHREAFKRFFE
jgi:two-component system LytT family response regulator